MAGGITVKFELGVPYKGSLSLAELDLKDAFRQTCVASFAITRRSGQILKYAIGVNRGWDNVSPASDAWKANGNVSTCSVRSPLLRLIGCRYIGRALRAS